MLKQNEELACRRLESLIREIVGGIGRIHCPHAVGLVSRTTTDTGTDACDAAVDALLKETDPEVFEPLFGVIHGNDPLLIHMAINKLGEIGDSSAIGPLTFILVNKRASLRRAAVRAIDRIGSREALPHLRARLQMTTKEPDKKLRASIRSAIRRIEEGTAGMAGLPRHYEADAQDVARRPRSMDETPELEALPRYDAEICNGD